jgi:pimeloyl-ACP methyl ester carboxylesterase
MPKKVVFIPGLGFTPEIFKNLPLRFSHTQYLEWMDPWPEESIGAYAQRMSQVIAYQGEELILIGHSLGGIMAQEIAAHLPVAKIVLLSSIRSRAENPWQFRVVRHTGFQHFFTKEGARRTFPLWGGFLGYETLEEQELFLRMIGSQSNTYLKWALVQLSRWQGSPSPQVPVLQIHGTRDRTFPYRLIQQPGVSIEGGNHNMVYNRGSELKPYIEDYIESSGK